MEWTQLFTIALGAILVNNFIVAQFLGICPFMGVSKKIETASGMGLAVIFVMGLASAICWPINELILVPMGLTFMQTVTYILVIASLVQFIEMFLKKAMPSLYEALGVYLPLITTNCAVLGVVLQNTQNGYGFIESVVYGVTGGIGFLLVIVILPASGSGWSSPSGPRLSRASRSPWWPPTIALAFMGFSGLKVFG